MEAHHLFAGYREELGSRSGLGARGRRGAVLLVALLFSAAIAISLGSYLQVSRSTLELSHRSLYLNAAMNLAETGLEEAMWSINQTNWSDWKKEGTTARRSVTGFDLGGGASGKIDVVVRNFEGGGAPLIVARSTVRPARGNAMEKWIAVTLDRRSLFANGLVARNKITFNGNTAYVDSYDSRLGPYGALIGVLKFNRSDKGSVGSVAVNVDSVSVGNANIWGYASVGTSDLSGLDVGPNGRVGPYGTGSGVINAGHVSTDFAANFDDVAHPPSPIPRFETLGKERLPRAGDTPDADGFYRYSVGQISLSGGAGNMLEIKDNVILVMDTNLGTTIDVKGNGSIAIEEDATLTIYTNANVAIAGRGVGNQGTPKNFFLYGTRPTSAATAQNISISGNGQLRGVVYAPSANLTLNGGGSSGEISGAAIANNVTINGGSAFHYDVALAELNEGGAFGITRWDELTTAAARNVHRALLAGM